ncbi:ADP-ribosyl cyclase/cyclic ADP-ribose hydrolase 1-like [Gouania willdenowi]|uniref:ADP-ribosyl cyclase/cyclic ADP-ribose hydrolase n=1 Tax=Gouania willdenowi TaxID=441366 RepID=A0A8C5I1Q4_GOUWI|nr:ADP-ribosyl cyclase/cyclic ADP-ribose hydrolase 1-like [Gouania willdenowi]
MEVEHRQKEKRRRRRCVIVGVAVVLLVITVLSLGLGLGLRREKHQIKPVFLSRCEKFSGNNCQKIWDAFQQAYVNQDPCKVPVEAYDPLIAAAPFKSECNRMLFWSKTKDVVHDFTEKKDCFITLEDTLLGSVLDGLTWCGKEGSSDTFTTGCPGWTDCENNPVRSFWNRASAAFAEAACGAVTVMLNGSIATPFHPASIFASIEVKKLNATRAKNLNVVLVTDEHIVANCTNPSLKDLKKELDKGIKYNCEEVPQSQIEACASNPMAPCGTCW